MEEFDDDDDFSDLYADVEVQASSAISTMHGLTEVPPETDVYGFSKLAGENDGISKHATGGEEKNGLSEFEIAVGNGGSYGNATGVEEAGENEEEVGLSKLSMENGSTYESESGSGSGSESEDDLHIVLNDGDGGKKLKFIDNNDNGCNDNCKNGVEFGVKSARKHGGEEIEEEEKKEGEGINGNEKNLNVGCRLSKRKYTRTWPALVSSILKGNGSGGTQWEDNECGQLMGGSPVVGLCGSNFSLPPSRTVLDVNIDSLERQPWRHPRSDVTDFFNFGFDEDGWKRYCSDVDRYHEQTMKGNRIPAFKLQQHTKLKGGSIQAEDKIGMKEPSSDENSVNRDSDLVVQDYKEGSLNSEEEAFDQTVSQVHEPSMNRNAGVDKNRDIYFSGRSKDGTPSLGIDYEGRGKIVSGRGSRSTPACDPMSLDLDKCGTVQISDSDEDNHHELSDCDSDGMAEVVEVSDDMDIRNASSISNKVPSAVEPESFQSGWGQHGPGFSCSPCPCAAVTNDDTGKSHKHSKKLSLSSDPGLRELATCDYHTSKDSKSHSVRSNAKDDRFRERDRGPKGKSHKHSEKPSTSVDPERDRGPEGKSHKHSAKALTSLDPELWESVTRDNRPFENSKTHGMKSNTRNGRYCERDRGPIRRDLKLERRSNHASNLKTHLNGEDAYDGIDIRHRYDMHQSTMEHEKQTIFSSNEKDTPYCTGTEGLFTYLSDIYPNHHSRPVCLKKQHQKVHPSFGCVACRRGDYNVNEKQTSLRKRRAYMGCKNLEDDWYHNERRRTVKNMNPLNFEESGKLNSEHSYAVNGRGTQFSEKENGVQLGRRAKGVDLPQLREYNADYRRYMLNSDRNRGHLDRIYDHDIPCDRREMESPGRDRMKYDDPFNSFDNSWYMENDDNDRRYIKHRPPPYRACKETRVLSRAQFQGAAGSKSNVPERPFRNMRCLWKERRGESDRYGCNYAAFGVSKGPEYRHAEDHLARRRYYQQSTITFNTNGSISYDHDQERFIRRRHHWQPEILHLNEEDYKSNRQDETIYQSKGLSNHFERISRNKRVDKGHGTDCVAEFINDREVDGHRCKLIGDGNCSNRFDQRSNIIHPDSRVQIYPRYQDSVDPCLVLKGKKCTMLSSRRTTKAGDAVHYGRYNIMEQNGDREHEYFKELNNFNPEKAVSVDVGKVDTNQSDKNWQNKLSNKQNEFLDIEEGQIVVEEINENTVDFEIASKDMPQINKTAHPEIASNGSRIADRLDEQKIQEIIMKMEKRKERFKDPNILNMDCEKTSEHFPDLGIETAVGKLVRPARKRKWLGS